MKKSAKKIKTEIDSLTTKLKAKKISTEEAFIIFERVILDLTAIYGSDNDVISKLKNDFIKSMLRLNKIEILQKDLQALKKEEEFLFKKYSISHL